MINLYRVVFRDIDDAIIYIRDVEYNSDEPFTAFGQALLTSLVDYQANSMPLYRIDAIECRNLGEFI